MRKDFLRRYFSDAFVVAATVFLFLLLMGSLFAPQLAPYDPDQQNIINQFQMPSAEHWLGTDEFGRDTFSRILFGGRLMIQAVTIAMVLALVLGVPIGLLSGYVGGRFDRGVMWFVDILFSLPGVMVAFAIVAILGTGLTNAMIAVGIVFATRFARLTRGLVLAEREELYVDSARVGGLRTHSILFGQVLPNMLPSLIVQVALLSGAVILVEASLSFLGLGVNVGVPSWGLMLWDMQSVIRDYPFGVLPPGIMIVLTVLSFNLIGDGIRDSLGRDVRHHQLTVSKRGEEKVISTEPHAADAVLSVRGLEVRFPGELTILNNVSFEIMPGETLGLVGESGSGKSMTALSLLGLVPAPGQITAGSIQFNGREMTSLGESDLNQIRGKDISIIFQEPWAALNPSLKVGDQLTEKIQHHMHLSGVEAEARALELLKLVRMPDPKRRLDEYAHQLSGGMAQRVGIAMALACGPQLLIADEPTTALDVTVQGQILDLLADLQAKLGMAILFITHDLSVVAEICDRAAVMYAGQIVEVAVIDDLFENPKHPYTAALLETMPQTIGRREGRLTVIEGMVPAPSSWPAGCRFHPRCRFAKDVCKMDQVAIRAIAPGRLSRCLRIDEITLGTSESSGEYVQVTAVSEYSS
jgi:peptide/nickel transport system permease protein